jgi:thioredoxin 1
MVFTGKRYFAVHVFISTVALVTIIASCNKPKDAASPEHVPVLSTSAELDSVSSKAAGLTLVLDFYANWCGPCRILAPTIDELAKEYKGKSLFYRVNIDNSQELALSFGARAIPYIVFMKDRKAVYALTGLNPADTYRKVLDMCANTGSADDCLKKLNEKM